MNVCYRMIFHYCLIYDIIKSTVSYVLLKKGIKLRHLPYLSRALDKKGEDQKARWQPIAFITSCKKNKKYWFGYSKIFQTFVKLEHLIYILLYIRKSDTQGQWPAGHFFFFKLNFSSCFFLLSIYKI